MTDAELVTFVLQYRDSMAIFSKETHGAMLTRETQLLEYLAETLMIQNARVAVLNELTGGSERPRLMLVKE